MPHTQALKHVEPYCTDPDNGCEYVVQHHHGLACDDSCIECQGKCHPSCPAYSEIKRGNAAFEAFIDGAPDAVVAFIASIEERKDNG